MDALCFIIMLVNGKWKQEISNEKSEIRNEKCIYADRLLK